MSDKALLFVTQKITILFKQEMVDWYIIKVIQINWHMHFKTSKTIDALTMILYDVYDI